jgi:3-phenylpropionate/cinnamic acid dioxygenase small subunit
MVLTVEDRLAIHELIALHGHLMDDGEFHRLAELFTSDVVYDVREFGLEELRGAQAITDAALALGDGNPIGHHATNVMITAVEDDGVRVVSKGIGIRADGGSGTVVYEDLVRREAAGWRIARRRVVVRRKPLHRG